MPLDFRWPMGDAPYDGLDGLLLREQSAIRRRRSPFEPPEGKWTPDIVPKSLFISAQKDDLLTRAGSLAIQHDASDLAFNASLRGQIEGMAPLDYDIHQQDVPYVSQEEFLIQREDEAIAETRRMQLGGIHIGDGQIVRTRPNSIRISNGQIEVGLGAELLAQQEQRKSLLGRIGGVVTAAVDTSNALVSFLTGEQDVLSTGRQIDSSTRQVLEGTIDLTSAIITPVIPFAGAGAAIEAVEERDPTRILRMSPGDSATFLSFAGRVAETAFDGQSMYRAIATHTAASWVTGFGTNGDYDAALHEMERRWDEELWPDLPRPVQLFYEEFNAGNIATALAGGPASRVLLASGTKGGTLLGRLIEPIASKPALAVASEVTAAIGARGGFEATEGQNIGVRLAAGAAGGIAAGGAPSVIAGGVRRVAAGELLSIPSFARTNDYAPGLREALGTGGRIKAGHPDEVLDPIALEVRNSWRDNPQSVTLGGRIIPADYEPRSGMPMAGRLVRVPDVINIPVSPQHTGVRNLSTAQTGRTQSLILHSPRERAADFAAQLGQDVPPAIARAADRAQADVAMRDGRLGGLIARFNGASRNSDLRAAIIGADRAQYEFLARVTASRGQFMDRVRQTMGSTDRLPDRIQYVGPSMRPHARGVTRQIRAEEHPATGTIMDYILNPQYYDQQNAEFLGEAVRFNARNNQINETLRSEYGVNIRDFNTEINAPEDVSGLMFFPARDRNNRLSTFRARNVQHSTPLERLADEDYDQIWDLNELFTDLDGQKARGVYREAFRYLLGGSTEPVPGWREVEALRVQAPNGAIVRRQYLPEELATQADEFLNSQSHRWAQILENIKNTTLGADFSPLFIQGVIGTAANPYDGVVNILRAATSGTVEGNPLRSMTRSSLYRSMAASPNDWMDFFTWFGRAPDGGRPEEWRSAFIEQVPILGRLVSSGNDHMSIALMRGMQSDFREYSTMLAQRGFDENTAKGAAIDIVRMQWLNQGFTELGVNRSRQSVERGALISSTFIRQPANLMAHAMAGFAQLMYNIPRHPIDALSGRTWQHVGPREQLALLVATKMSGTMLSMAAVGALATAEARGYTPAEAIYETIFNTDGSEWLEFAVPGTDIRLPLGGPYRGMIRAMMPQPMTIGDQTIIPYDVPFGGAFNFLERRITTTVGTAYEVMRNEDFYGDPIRNEDSVFGALESLMYAAQNTVPIAVGAAIESAREGEGVGAAGEQWAWEFLGQNPQEPSEWQAYQQELRFGAQQISQMNIDDRIGLGMSEAQAEASMNAMTYNQLVDAIGTRSARWYAELARPEVRESRDEYIESLRGRAETGDELARALLVSVDMQTEIEAAVQEHTDEYGVDKEALRDSMNAITNEYMGKSEALSHVFDTPGRPKNEIDRLTEERFGLRDKARLITVLPDGTEIDRGIDFDLLEQLELEFDQRIGSEMAALVSENAGIPPSTASDVVVEWREVRRALTDAGRWEVNQRVFDQDKERLAAELASRRFNATDGSQTGVAKQPTLDAIESSHSLEELRNAMIPVLMEAQFRAFPQLSEAEARARAQREFNSVASTHYDLRSEAIKEWVSQNIDNGLAHSALEWGYISEAQYRGGGGFLGAIEEAREDNTSEPQSTNLNDTLRDEYASGLSYGQIAIRHDMTREAVRSRLRRQVGNSPTQLRT